VNHVDIVLEGDSNDVVLSQVGSNRTHALSNHITLVTLVSMSIHPVFVRVNGDCRHGQLVSGSKDSNSDFTSVGNEDFFERSSCTGLLLSQARDAVDQRVNARCGCKV
jgi:hypothetical protein